MNESDCTGIKTDVLRISPYDFVNYSRGNCVSVDENSGGRRRKAGGNRKAEIGASLMARQMPGGRNAY